MARTMDANEKKWQREDDAHALIRAEEIKNDKARMDGAQQEIERQAKEAEDRAGVMRQLSKSGTKGGRVGKQLAKGMAADIKPGGVTMNPGINWNK